MKLLLIQRFDPAYSRFNSEKKSSSSASDPKRFFEDIIEYMSRFGFGPIFFVAK